MAKKTFKTNGNKISNPADLFMDVNQAAGQDIPPASKAGTTKAPKNAPEKISAAENTPAEDTANSEIRNKRVQILITPTMYEQAKQAAWENHESMNSYIYNAIDKALKEKGDK
jgi:predicted HicB family RNase H-like nuclease